MTITRKAPSYAVQTRQIIPSRLLAYRKRLVRHGYTVLRAVPLATGDMLVTFVFTRIGKRDWDERG